MSYVAFTLEHSNGDRFVALGPEDAISPASPDTGSAVVLLAAKWGYGTGQRPAYRCGHVNAGATGTRMVMQTISGNQDQVARVRVIRIDGSNIEVTFDGVAASRTLARDNSYVDVWVGPDGEFQQFGNVSPFDRNSTEGSEGLMDEVDAARALHDVD